MLKSQVSYRAFNRDVVCIILARAGRMAAHAGVTLILAQYFAKLNFSDVAIGTFMSLTLLGDIFLGLFLGLIADPCGRRRICLLGSVMMVFTGIAFVWTDSFWILLAASVFGVLSVTGVDFGPFRTIEESMLYQITDATTRPNVLSWYTTATLAGASIGGQSCGYYLHKMQSDAEAPSLNAYHGVFTFYIVAGILNVVLILLLSDKVEVQNPRVVEGNALTWARDAGKRIIEPWLSSRPSSSTSRGAMNFMRTLWTLLAIEAGADGLVPLSLTFYYLDQHFHLSVSTLGHMASATYVLAAVVSTLAGPISNRYGLVKAMACTHAISSAAILLFPVAPDPISAFIVLLIRSSLHNLDQAPRGALIAIMVPEAERTAFLAVAGMLRTVTSTPGPYLTGVMSEHGYFKIAFVLAGSIRLGHDCLTYVCFSHLQPMLKAGKEGHDEATEVLRLDDDDLEA